MVVAFRVRPVLGTVALLIGAALAAWWVQEARAYRMAQAAALSAEVARVLERLFEERALALVNGDPSPMASFYDRRAQYGVWALEHELRRVEYVRQWTRKRGVRLVQSESEFRIASLRPARGGEELWVNVAHTVRFGYVYDDDPQGAVNHFGIGTRHAIELVRKDGAWLVRREWYTDPLDEDTLIPEVMPADSPGPPALPGGRISLEMGTAQTSALGVGGPPAYDRTAAVAYADTYCGLAWGCGNSRRYHPGYRDYDGIGGDCTNFVSQALAAGGLPMDGTWYYREGSGGSRAWVQAESLAAYLVSNGRGQRIARGTFAEVAGPTEQWPQGAIAQLRPGDLIGYEEKGRLVHFAMVTGRDSRGYPLVNSHTADRYRVPWDIGWDRSTRFWLIQIRDG